MRLEARAQLAGLGLPRRFPCGNRNVDRRQFMLVQTKGLSGEAFDAIARDRGAEGTRGYTQSQSRVSFMIGKDR